MIDVTKIPLLKTVTLGSTVEEVKIRNASTGPAKFCELVTISNISSTQPIYIGLKSTAQADGEEFTLNQGTSMTIPLRMHGSYDVFVRGTSGEKFAIFIQ